MASAHDTDPRTAGEYVHRVPETSITLVGVVHDHPASSYRARQTVETVDPDVLALELSPLAVPLFEAYARSERTPPLFGGEMSAAIQFARTASVVGVDRPTPGFLWILLRNLLRDRPSSTTVKTVLGNVLSTTKHAVVCRLAAAATKRTSVRLEVDSPVRHDTDWRDTPEDQAHDERQQIQRSQSFMNAFQTASASRASRFEDVAREEYMANRLSELCSKGSVVAVVGIDHFEPLIDRLNEAETQTK